MVNVNDFKNDRPEGDLLEAIFARQTQLMEKYDPIEEKNLGHPIPHGIFDLNSPACQQRLKDFAWRVVEELTEATECADADDKTHFLEELIDSFHFFVEMMIHSGIKSNKFCDPHEDQLEFIFKLWDGSESSLQQKVWMCVEDLGKAMNCLKNKPWKQTHMITDADRYLELLASAFNNFIGILHFAGFTAESATRMYFNKSDVNGFRIRSKY